MSRVHRKRSCLVGPFSIVNRLAIRKRSRGSTRSSTLTTLDARNGALRHFSIGSSTEVSELARALYMREMISHAEMNEILEADRLFRKEIKFSDLHGDRGSTATASAAQNRRKEQRRAEHELRARVFSKVRRQMKASLDSEGANTNNAKYEDVGREVMAEIRKMDPKVLGFNPTHSGGEGNRDTEETKEQDHDLEKEIDPIMLSEIEPTDVTYTFKRPNGSNIKYKVESLIDYMLSTGEFREPESRIPFSEEHLEEIDEIAAKNNLRKNSLVNSMRNPKVFDVKHETQDQIVGLERCTGELIAEMVQVIESSSHEDGEVELLVRIFPGIQHYFELLQEIDQEYANQCIKQYAAFVEGPPNRRTRDRSRLLQSCLKFLQGLTCDEQDVPSSAAA